jgi:hypothetical protein
MSAPDFNPAMFGPTPDQYAQAAAWFGETGDYQQVFDRLVQSGMKEEFAWQIVRDQAGKGIQAQVVMGGDEQKMLGQLVAWGLSENQARDILDFIAGKVGRRMTRGRGLSNYGRRDTLLFASGIVCFLIGAPLLLLGRLGIIPIPGSVGLVILFVGAVLTGMRLIR